MQFFAVMFGSFSDTDVFDEHSMYKQLVSNLETIKQINDVEISSAFKLKKMKINFYILLILFSCFVVGVNVLPVCEYTHQLWFGIFLG